MTHFPPKDPSSQSCSEWPTGELSRFSLDVSSGCENVGSGGHWPEVPAGSRGGARVHQGRSKGFDLGFNLSLTASSALRLQFSRFRFSSRGEECLGRRCTPDCHQDVICPQVPGARAVRSPGEARAPPLSSRWAAVWPLRP